MVTLCALIFDMDGTLADSDPFHRQAFAEVLAPYGVMVDDEFYRSAMSGRANPEIFAHLFPDRAQTEHETLSDLKEALFRELAAELMPLEGLMELLRWAGEHRLALGLVTNSPTANMDHMLRALQLKSAFPVRVAAEDVTRPKPDPLPYRTALERLNVTAGEAIAFEDSLSGVRAAKAAGLFTVGVMTGQSAETLRQAGADEVVHHFRDPALWRILDSSGPKNRSLIA